MMPFLTIKSPYIYLDAQRISDDENIMANTQFDYYNVRADSYNEIKSSTDIVKNDASFLQEIQDYPERSFCDTSAFWCGCIKIKAK